jgi:hypothetical protein
MANGKAQKTLEKILEGEHLAANALAVAMVKAKDGKFQEFLNDLRQAHESNIEKAGEKLVEAGGKYPVPKMREQLKSGWQGVATSKTAQKALKTLEKKEREALLSYKDMLKKVNKDEELSSLVLRNMAITTENIAKLSEELSRQYSKKKGGGFFRFLILLALIGAAVYGATKVMGEQKQ